jgi:PadR family transcriptional regulator
MGSDQIRLSNQALKILKVFLDAYDESVREQMSGADVMRRTGMLSGTVYPWLLRFEANGLLESVWEGDSPQELGRPRRRLYWITPKGVQMVRAAIREILPRSFSLPNEVGH